MTETSIAKIVGTWLGFEDHGLLIANIDFDYGGAGQGTGTILGSRKEIRPETQVFLMAILDACGVDRWEKLIGRTVMVTHDWGKIYGIGPLPTERGTAFVFADVFESGGG